MNNLGLTHINARKLSRRTALVDGGVLNAQSGSRGAVTKYNSGAANLCPLPSGSISRPEPLLERGYLSQALLDIGALFFLFLFIISAALSVPLAMFLLIFARL
ncbi:hypothetical protein [Bradyrhizobium sp. 930_D9_N1_4]|uniref:hypothetical protein n=1 Tax=Bradyrhizobium sp. 930_D9_N1_4 TaxID=3240374 RepID=UPI003F88770E